MPNVPRQIFRRYWEIAIGDNLFYQNQENPMDISFYVQKTNRREMNTAEISLYNLSNARSESITRSDGVTLKIGYQGELNEIIFLGDISEVYTEWEGKDRVTKLTCRDGLGAYSDVRVSLQFPEGTSVLTVIRRLLSEMNVGEGNLSGLNQGFERRNRPTTFETGFSCRGRAWRTVNNLIRSAGFNWSIQDGNIQIRRGTDPIREESTIVLSPDSGLIGNVSRDVSSDRHNTRTRKVNVVALPINGFYIGRVIQLSSREVEGFFQINRVNYSGETFSETWEVELELEEVNAR